MSTNVASQTKTLSDTLRVSILGQDNGLLQLNVKSLAKDNLGYLWAGTEDGLHRYNGYTFKPYSHSRKDSTSIKDDHIRDLLITNDTLWIATNTKGINGFLLSENMFFSLNTNLTNKELNTAYKIFEIDKDYLLFATQNHFIIFNRKLKSSDIISLEKLTTENTINGVIKLEDDELLLASNSGVLNYNITTKQLNANGDFTTKDYSQFLELEDSFLLGHDLGLTIQNKRTQQKKELPLNEKVKCIYQLNSNEIIIGTALGVYTYNLKTDTLKAFVFRDINGTIFSKVNIASILKDQIGNLWIGTEGEGLIQFNQFQEKFSTLKLKLKGYSKTNKISSFQYLKGEDSTLYIGASSDLVKYDFKSKQFKPYNIKGKPLIYTIVRDENNTIWAGGFTSGLLKYDSKTDEFKEIKSSAIQLKDRDVIQVTVLNKEELLVATWSGGLYFFNIKNETFFPYTLNNQMINRARCSFKDSKGHIWLGTDNGVYEIQLDKTIKHYTEDNLEVNLSSNRVFSIAEDTYQNIWFGTSVGLTKLFPSRDKTVIYSKQKGLPNDFIYSVLIDEENQLWLSTNHGLSVFNPKNELFRNYTKKDGLQNNEFNGKAGYKDQFGNFYFGGIDGINIFNPNKIVANPYLPKVYIEEVDLFNKPLNKNELFKSELFFKSHENVITFNYSALSFINSEKINYSYKLDGFDDDWRSITKERATTYTNLDPGDYVFKVKATNDSGVWSDSVAKLKLKIIPPWYKTLWFKLVMLFSGIVLLLLFYLYKTRKLKQEQVKLKQLVDARTEEILLKNKDLEVAFKISETQKNNIKFLMRELRHRVKNNLQIVSSLLNIQSKHLSDAKAINALKVAKNRILTISYLEDKMGVESDAFNIKEFTETLCDSILQTLSDEDNIKFKIQYDIENIEVSHLNTTLYGLILNEIITNTVKHAFTSVNENHISIIKLNKEKEDLILVIADNGKGYQSNQISTTSLGLDLINDMVKQLNGDIKTETKNGVKNTIIIPTKKNVYA